MSPYWPASQFSRVTSLGVRVNQAGDVGGALGSPNPRLVPPRYPGFLESSRECRSPLGICQVVCQPEPISVEIDPPLANELVVVHARGLVRKWIFDLADLLILGARGGGVAMRTKSRARFDASASISSRHLVGRRTSRTTSPCRTRSERKSSRRGTA
jgi:hypothetical protein